MPCPLWRDVTQRYVRVDKRVHATKRQSPILNRANLGTACRAPTADFFVIVSIETYAHTRIRASLGIICRRPRLARAEAREPLGTVAAFGDENARRMVAHKCTGPGDSLLCERSGVFLLDGAPG